MMNRSMGKARSSRKQRLDGAHKGRPARPGGRVPRVVKARGAAVPVPANDTALDVRRADAEIAETIVSPELVGGDEHALLAPGVGPGEELEVAGVADAVVEVEEVDAEADTDAQR